MVVRFSFIDIVLAFVKLGDVVSVGVVVVPLLFVVLSSVPLDVLLSSLEVFVLPSGLIPSSAKVVLR